MPAPMAPKRQEAFPEIRNICRLEAWNVVIAHAEKQLTETRFFKNFVKLVLIANVIAWPVAWCAMNRWLQNFAYRIDIGWWVFALAGGLALLIAFATVSTQAIRAALANPVEALRYE